MEEIVLVGFGGHAKSVADSIERQGQYKIVGYTDQRDNSVRYPYLGTDDVLETLYEKGIRNAAICMGYLGKGIIRNRLYERLKMIGYTLPVIVDPSAIVAESAVLAEGTFVGKLAIVNAEAQIGKMAIINSKALVEHECIVDAFTHVAVGAVLCGQCKIGAESLIGANATVLQGIELPAHSIVPAGEVVRWRKNHE